MKVYRGAARAARNYVESDRCRADDYYLAEGTGLAERLSADADGRIVELPALSGDGYEAWVGGLDPETGQPRGRVRADGHAVRFVEVVVNGPKSWSLAAELHPDVAAAYEAAQDRAARQILSWLGEHATTRVGPRGQQVAVPVQRLEAAVIRHYTSRAGDPHRHLHVQVNARVFAAGRWRGLDTIAFRDSIAAINGIGHAAVACDPEFRAALAAHGYTLTGTGELAQLTGYVGAFSKRASQIGRLLDRYQAAWRREHPGQEPGPRLRRAWDARAWAEDRPDKLVPRDGADLRARWLAELHALGYRDRDKPLQLALTLPGTLDRDRAAGEVVARLGAGRSAWNPADVRGEVEQLLARHDVIAEPAARSELAEDLTARALDLCTRLREQPTPEHIRTLTSAHVLDVEAELVNRFAGRGAHPIRTLDVDSSDGLDVGQRAAVALLAGDATLVVIEGAAGAGKTTMLAAAHEQLDAQGRLLLVVTPTLKAAQVATTQIGTKAGSAAWLAHQYGWRWDEDGVWTRERRVPAAGASLRPGDVLLVDEAGMLDQDTAHALLSIADQTGARVALVGDRRQLPAVGRGGVLELAHRWAHPEARADLTEVHRFLRELDGELVPDTEYAALTLALRDGDDPGAVFDALHARGQLVIHASEIERQDALAAHVAGQRRNGGQPAVVVDTREQADALNAVIREQLITADDVDDRRVALTRDGQRLGAGDLVVTRRNDPDLDVANRETWKVMRVRHDGRLTITNREHGRRELPAEYARRYVELGYASTGYGVQGDTTSEAHVLVSDKTTAAGLYVGLTRGRYANLVHLVAENLDDAREQWISAATRDRADLGPEHAAARAARETAGYTPARPLDQILTDLHAAWREQADAQRELDQATALRDRLTEVAALQAERDQALAPLEVRHQQAKQHAEQARAAAEHSAAAIEAHVTQIRDQLTAQWQAQREQARQHARTVQKGPGRLGIHLLAVNRATEELARWSLTWQPSLPDMPTDTVRIARFASWPDNRERLELAFEAYARAQAARAHPDHPALQQAVEHARQQQSDARRQISQARQSHHERLVECRSLAHRDDAAAHLDELGQQITKNTHRLTVAERCIDQLAAEPAVAAQPSGWLASQHKQWRTRQEAAETLARVAQELSHARGPLAAETLQPAAYQHVAYPQHYGHDAGRDGPDFGI